LIRPKKCINVDVDTKILAVQA